MPLQPDELIVVYGDRPDRMVADLLEHIELAPDLPAKGTIGIKPNLVLPAPSASGATTDPLLVEGLIGYLQANGFRDLVILESSWVGAQTHDAFEACGYVAVSERFGVPLVDLKDDSCSWIPVAADGIRVCDTALGLAYLINLPVIKAHCQTGVTCALKNLKGCIPDAEKRRFHDLGLDEPIARLNQVLKTDLVIADGIVGDLTFEEGGNPVRLDRLVAGRDPVLVDAYAASLLGHAPRSIGHIRLAEQFGVGCAALDRTRIRELNPVDATPVRIPRSGLVGQLARRVEADRACSACFGGLMHALMRLKDTGDLSRLPGPVRVGQGFLGRTGPGPGIGRCALGLDEAVDGCPPTAHQMLEFLRGIS